MIKQTLLACAIMSTCWLPASAANVINSCGWNHPGTHPYKGGAIQGINDYKDIPPDVRLRLISRVKKMDFDSAATISRNGISGGFHPEITDMHFGSNTLCRDVNRDVWPTDHSEVGLTYCEGEYCLIIPTVCGNVSRIRRAESKDPIVPFVPRPKKDGKMLPGLEPRGVPWVPPPATYIPMHPGAPEPTPIPIPSTLWLVLGGFIGILMGLKRPGR